ncbi:hypothetical protein [Nonomuraea bangladeshensis]|uniref:hypothetical protein n=1 Tax=Nonomuraea bangladeshensis TaxID=404385 RepID=UPI003C2F1221
MTRRKTGQEHLDAAQECLEEMTRARRDGDWAKVSGLADAAQAHAAVAAVAQQVITAPAILLAGKQGQQWMDAAGVDRPR